MAEKQELEALKLEDESPKPSFVEVLCKSSGKIRRFAPGTHAAFAVKLINKKLLVDDSCKNSNSSPLLASHIEAVKVGHDSEEPISFGPTATLLNYGSPWILQTVVAKGQDVYKPKRHSAKGSEGSRSAKKTSQLLGLWFIGKIVLALLVIYMIGSIFMLALQNLPALFLYIHTDM